jgi:peptidyl-prolyl cis-trans isomerase A (cyclophilin A)/peptidyl-prolyl cis-trans isomerase B (cyclophilin B)
MKQLLLILSLLAAGALHTSPAADVQTSPAPTVAAAAAPATAAAPPTAPAPTGGAGADKPEVPASKPASTEPVQVRVVTSLGSFVIEVLPDRAPLTAAHFLKYVDQGYYSGTIFHRVIPNFVIQGGGFDTTFKIKGTPTKVVNESGNGLTNQRGTVGLARPTEPHAGDVQFYVNLFDNAALDPNPNRWGYAVFGKIVQGMDVVDRIGNVATGVKGPFKEDSPLTPVVIEKIERVTPP